MQPIQVRFIVMRTKSTISHRCCVNILLVRVVIVVLMALAPFTLLAQAGKYVTFNDGRLLVFPAECISDFHVGDDVVTITAIDGVDYTYDLADVLSIDDELTKSLPVITSYRIDKNLNYQIVNDAEAVVADDAIRIEVGGIGKWLTASFTLSESEATAFVDEVQQESEVSRLNFAQDRVYTVGYAGDKILTVMADGSCSLKPYGRRYVVSVDFLADHTASAPRIDINTEGGADITSKVEYLNAVIIIDGMGVFPSMTDSVMVRGRGNTSWSSNPAAKNSYRLKFASKKSPFGLTRGKNWVLLANKIKGSMLTNAIGMKAASLLGTIAPNHIIPVDLYVNGTYKGNYNFTEKIGFSNNSVDLPDESVAALLELDRYYDEPEGQKFRSVPQDIPVNVKSPDFSDTAIPVTLEMVSDRFNAFVAAVLNGKDLSPHVDIDALARYLMVNELICNKEIFHPKSTFCFYENVLDEDSKLVFGPVWDMDWGCGYVGFSPYSYFTQLIDYDFFNRVYTGDQYWFFRAMSKNRKLARRMFELIDAFVNEGLDELCDFCGDYYAFAAPSLHHSIEAFADEVNYETQAANAAVWLRARANMIYRNRWIDQFDQGDVNGDGEINIADVNALIDVILSGSEDEYVLKRADVNDDGEINVADVNTLIDIIIAQGAN